MEKKKQKLELTWIGKEKRARLEPRVLVEKPELSHHAATRRRDGKDIFDNMLIHGDNLLALKALEQQFAGQVKCIYIDPPFNTGAAFENYDDGLEHSIWLGLMRERVQLLYNLMTDSGSFFIHLDDNEVDYCKVILDEIFGRSNFVNRVTIEARAPSAFSTVNPGVFKATEYILWYAKDKTKFVDQSVRIKRDPDYAYNKWIDNPEEDCSKWTFSSVVDAFSLRVRQRSSNPRTVLDKFNAFIVENADRICRFASISDSGAGQKILELKKKSLENPQKMFFMKRDGGLDDVYVVGGQQLIFYSKNVSEIDGEMCATRLLTNIWTDIAWEGIATEGGVTFRKGKKPERLLRRVIDLSTNPGDLILDSFLGSGTTAAVAHKMGRRWIGVELGDHCYTHCKARLDKVIDSEDAGGITKSVGWKGGGGYRFYELAPTLITTDKWGQEVINKAYKPEMLAEAVCKLEGFTYAPSESEYFIHGHSTERDYIYVTTTYLKAEHLRALSDLVGPERTLLVCCKGFSTGVRLPNLTVKKIPKAVLDKCEYGHDDYSLNVKNLPMSAPELKQGEMTFD
jgi:adenine-specific DNA-methyltransferase